MIGFRESSQSLANLLRFWAERLELDGAIVARARDRGEIGPRTQSWPVIEMVLGPLYFRLLVTGEPLDDDFIKGIVDLVHAACRHVLILLRS